MPTITKQVRPIVVDGYTFPMHSSYFFDLKKVYTKDPTRSLNGHMNTFPDKFFTPYFKVTYGAIPLDVYYQMMNKIQTNEQTVEYYDSFTGEYKAKRFYAQQPTYNQMYSLKQEYSYILNLELIFSATNTDMPSTGTITYSANGGIGNVPSTQSGAIGNEFIVSTANLTNSGYTFECWNTSEDGTGVDYVPNSKNCFIEENITLYAKWKPANS